MVMASMIRDAGSPSSGTTMILRSRAWVPEVRRPMTSSNRSGEAGHHDGARGVGVAGVEDPPEGGFRGPGLAPVVGAGPASAPGQDQERDPVPGLAQDMGQPVRRVEGQDVGGRPFAEEARELPVGPPTATTLTRFPHCGSMDRKRSGDAVSPSSQAMSTASAGGRGGGGGGSGASRGTTGAGGGSWGGGGGGGGFPHPATASVARVSASGSAAVFVVLKAESPGAVECKRRGKVPGCAPRSNGGVVRREPRPPSRPLPCRPERPKIAPRPAGGFAAAWVIWRR